MSFPVPSVDILLATYNGVSFLAEQLDSLARQTHTSWRLIARDDGSTDMTRALLEDFRTRHPSTVFLVDDDGARLGVAGSFHRLLQLSTAAHFLPCDQDDVWQPDKIARLLALAAAQERPGVPFLVHSDLEVVDRRLRTLAPSFWRYQKINPANCGWSRLLVQNVVTGCACLGNAALRQAALPLPPDALMHDWWLALVAATSGEIRWLDAATVRYRQHGRNDTGAKRWDAAYVLGHSGEFFRRGAFRRKFTAYQRQAAALAKHRPAAIQPAVRTVLHNFAEIDRLPYPSRAALLWRHRILKTGWLRNLALLSRI